MADTEIIIGNERLITTRPQMGGVGPQDMIICETHAYVRRELLLRDGKYTVVCWKCLTFGRIMGSVQHVKSGERGVHRSYGGSD